MDDVKNPLSILRPRLRRIALRILGSGAQVEAVIDAAEVNYMSQCGDLDAAFDPTAWLVSTTLSLSFERRRAAATRPDVASDPPSASSKRIAELTQRILIQAHAALEHLAPEARLAFLLHDIFKVDLAELATSLGKRTVECQFQIEHARRELRQYHHRHAS